MDDPEAVALGEQRVAGAGGGRGAGPGADPGAVERGLGIEVEDPGSDGAARIDEPARDRPAVVGQDRDVAGAQGVRHPAHRAVVDPRVTGGDRVAERLGQAQARPAGHGPSGYFASFMLASWYEWL